MRIQFLPVAQASRYQTVSDSDAVKRFMARKRRREVEASLFQEIIGALPRFPPHA